MPRPGATPEVLVALASTIIRPAIFVKATFFTGDLFLWTGLGNISWGGETWLGIGSLGGISVIEDGASVEARGITLTLSGIVQSVLADVLQELQLGAPVIVYLGLFDETGTTLIPDPLVCWSGRMDQPTIEMGGNTAMLSINCENRLLEMNVAVDRRYTQDDAQISSPGDLAFQFVAGIQSRTIYW